MNKNVKSIYKHKITETRKCFIILVSGPKV